MAGSITVQNFGADGFRVETRLPLDFIQQVAGITVVKVAGAVVDTGWGRDNGDGTRSVIEKIPTQAAVDAEITAIQAAVAGVVAGRAKVQAQRIVLPTE